MTMTRIVVVILTLAIPNLCGGLVAIAQTVPKTARSGVLCVSSVPRPSPGETSLANSAGGGRSFNYSIRVDNGRILSVSHEEGIQFRDLAPGRRHVVRIYRDGKLVHSFRFGFEKEESRSLCLWFNALYETWSLWPDRDAKSKCDCS